MTKAMTRRQNGMIISALCAALLLCAMALTTVTAHAEGGTITVNYSDAKDNFDTTLQVYRVGHFENGNDLVWDDAVKAAGLDLPDVSEKNFTGNDKMKEWAETLASAGYTLKGALESDTDPVTIEGYPKDCSISKASGTGSVSVSEDGLFLIVGPREAVTTDGLTTGYTPVPAFVTVFTGRTQAQIAVKPSTDKAKNYQVLKDWDVDKKDAVREKLLRPEGIPVKIEYRDSAAGEWTEARSFETPDETVTLEDGKYITLNDENHWAFNWKSDVNREWRVEELLPEEAAPFYLKSQEDPSVQGESIRFTVKNTFDQRTLKLTKTIDEFVKHNDNVATTIVFRIDGYDKEGSIVYSVPASIDFTTAGTKDTVVDNIPVNLDKIEVTEVYTANYEPKGSTSVTVTKPNDQGVYEVSFENGWSKTVNYDSGIINKYGLENQTDLSAGYKILERIGLKKNND